MMLLLYLLNLGFAQCTVDASADAAYTLAAPDPRLRLYSSQLWVDDPTSLWSQNMVRAVATADGKANVALSVPEAV